MQVEIVVCAELGIAGKNGIGDAAARRLVDPATGRDFVETSYVGFLDEDLGDVMETILDGLRPDHDVGHLAVPSRDDLRDVASSLRAFCGPIPASDLKIVLFDAGGDDAEAFGRVAMMVRSEFDTRSHLDRAGMAAATLDAEAVSVPKP
jgi:hypothetical protein